MTTLLGSDNHFPLVRILEDPDPPDLPPAGEVHLKVDAATKLLYQVDDAGTITPLGAAGAYTPGGTDVAVADGGTGASSAAAARTNLGLIIGTDVQAFDADIPTVAASQAEMEAGTSTSLRSMTPERVAQAIAALAAGGVGGASPIAFGSPYMKPSTPGAMDEEWTGTADTLPTDWAWVSAAPTFHINSKLPGLFVIERADTTERKIRRSSFTMAATSGLWIAFACGNNATISSQFEFIIYDSASSNGYGFGVHNGNVWLARDSNAGSLANRGTYTSGDRGHMGIMGVTRVSNTWTTWLSFDGVTYFQVQSADTRSFTVDRLELRWSSDNAMAQRGVIGPIHYRADNLFPNVL